MQAVRATRNIRILSKLLLRDDCNSAHLSCNQQFTGPSRGCQAERKLALPFDQAEAMTEWIAAECDRPMLGVFKCLFQQCAGVESLRESLL